MAQRTGRSDAVRFARGTVAAAVTVFAILIMLVTTGAFLTVAAVGWAELPVPIVTAAAAFGSASAVLLLHGRRFGGVVLAAAAIGSGHCVLVVGLVAGGTDDPALLATGTSWMPGTLLACTSLGPVVAGLPRRLRGGRGVVICAASSSIALWVLETAMIISAGSSPVLATLTAIAGGGLLFGWLAGIVGLVLLARRAAVGDRDAPAWIAAAQSMVLVASVPSYSGSSGVVSAVAAAILPSTIILLAAVLLLTDLTRTGSPVDVTLARGVSWVLAVAALISAGAVVVGAVAVFTPEVPTTVGLVTVVGLALAVEPVRHVVLRVVDQLAYGRSAEPAALLHALSNDLVDGGTPAGGDVLGDVARALTRALRLRAVELRSTQPDGVRAAAGTLGGQPVSFDLRGPDGSVGTLLVSGAIGGGIDGRTRSVIATVSGMLALAMRLAEAHADTERARRQLLQASIYEQRTVHDELAAGVGAGVRAARTRIAAALADPDPEQARGHLAAAQQALAEVTSEVRDLARTLLPGALDAGDVVEAFAQLGARFARPNLTVDLTPQAQEHAGLSLALSYHLVADAVLRARREAVVSALRVRIDRTGTGLVLDLHTEPSGLPTTVLRALADRASETGARVVELDESGSVTVRMDS